MKRDRIHYAWAIVFACFLCCFSYGVFYTFGVFFKHLQVEFGWSRGVTSTIHSLHWIFFPISSLAIGWLTDRYGPKLPLMGGAALLGLGMILLSRVKSPEQFFLFYALASLGSGIIWSLPTAIVQRWFLEKRGMALGIVASGVGAGYCLSPLSSLLISEFGWRAAYLYIGLGVWLLLGVASWIIVGEPQEKGLKPYGTARGSLPTTSGVQGWDAGDAARTSSFWCICAIHICHLFALMIVAVHLINFATDVGINEVQAATAWFLVGLCSIPGRLVGGYAAEKIGYRWGFILCGVGNSLALIWLLAVSSPWMLFLFVVFYGFFYGWQTPLFPGVLGFYYGLKPLSTLVGLLLCTGIFSGTTAPLFAGFIFDKFSNYDIAFITAAGFWGLTALLAFLLRKPEKRIR